MNICGLLSSINLYTSNNSIFLNFHLRKQSFCEFITLMNWYIKWIIHYGYSTSSPSPLPSPSSSEYGLFIRTKTFAFISIQAARVRYSLILITITQTFIEFTVIRFLMKSICILYGKSIYLEYGYWKITKCVTNKHCDEKNECKNGQKIEIHFGLDDLKLNWSIRILLVNWFDWSCHFVETLLNKFLKLIFEVQTCFVIYESFIVCPWILSLKSIPLLYTNFLFI